MKLSDFGAATKARDKRALLLSWLAAIDGGDGRLLISLRIAGIGDRHITDEIDDDAVHVANEIIRDALWLSASHWDDVLTGLRVDTSEAPLPPRNADDLAHALSTVENAHSGAVSWNASLPKPAAEAAQ